MFINKKMLSTTFPYSGTPKSQWLVKVIDSTLNTTPGKKNLHPIPRYGGSVTRQVFGMEWRPSDLTRINNILFNTDQSAYVPRYDMRPLTGELSILSDLATRMSIRLNGGEEGYLAHGTFKEAIENSALNERVFEALMDKMRDFKLRCDQTDVNDNPQDMINLAREILEADFYLQWIVRGWLFEPVLTGDILEHDKTLRSDGLRYDDDIARPQSGKTRIMVPHYLARPLAASSAALGRDQLEFCYANYTLLAGHFPDGFDKENVDYDSSRSILDAIASISTDVSYLDTNGHSSDHNFRFDHVLMELQMTQAFQGLEAVLSGDKSGWDDISNAAYRAHKVFQTMSEGTPPKDYPYIRTMISGNYGNKPEYDIRGVFYEGLGTDRYKDPSGTEHSGVWVKNEYGQTGANSSMFKWFDTVIGVSEHRGAYTWTQEELDILLDVMKGKRKPSELKRDELRTMQFGFDLYTRPVEHMSHLVETFERIREYGLIRSADPDDLIGRLKTARWVAEHRIVHLHYVHTHIYSADPMGRQQAAVGTGGSTVEFLPGFIDDTISPMKAILSTLSTMKDQLSEQQLVDVEEMEKRMEKIESKKDFILKHGQKLQASEQLHQLSET